MNEKNFKLNSHISKIDYKEIFDKLKSGVAIYEVIDGGNNFRFININNAAEKIDQIKKEEIIGRKITEIFPNVKKFGLLKVLRKVWKSGEPKRHPVSNYKDNRITGWRDNYVFKLSSGKIVAIYDDVSDLKLQENELKKALKESERRRNEINALLKATKVVLEYKHFNDAARAIFDVCKEITGAQSGYVALLSEDGSENEVLFLDSGGLPCSVDPNLPMPIRGLRAEAYKTGRAIYNNDFMTSDWIKYLPEGHVKLKNVLFAPLNLEDKTIGLIGLANKKGGFNNNDKDLSEGLSELIAIALKNSQMLESLEESRKECLFAYNQANLYKDLFTHDISNIMQNIKYASTLASNYLNNSTIDDSTRYEEVHELISVIKDQLFRGSNLISNIRKLSNVEMIGGNLKKINLSKNLTKAIHFVKDSYPNRNIEIEYKHPKEKYYCSGNEFLVEVFENILINAIKHNENDPIKIEIKLTEIIKSDGDFIKIEFIDNGIGISETMKDRLFKSRIKKKEKTKGMGLGLMLTKRIIDVHNGKIWVENRVKGDSRRGSNFIVLLPLMD